MSNFVFAFNSCNGALVLESLVGKRLGDCFPDTTSSVTCGEAESCVGTPLCRKGKSGVSNSIWCDTVVNDQISAQWLTNYQPPSSREHSWRPSLVMVQRHVLRASCIASIWKLEEKGKEGITYSEYESVILVHISHIWIGLALPCTYINGRYSPNFVIVRTHEKIC